LARQYLGLADGYILIYDPDRPESLDALVMVKKDIDRNRDKKEVFENNHYVMTSYNLLWLQSMKLKFNIIISPCKSFYCIAGAVCSETGN
jgi:hypothetical protein